MKQARGRHYRTKRKKPVAPDQEYFRTFQHQLQRNLKIKINP